MLAAQVFSWGATLVSATINELTIERVLAVCLIILVTAIVTRLTSGRADVLDKYGDRVNTAPMVPYWLPFLGHIPNMIFAPDSLMRWARKTYDQGAFCLNFAGTTHTFIFNPTLCATISNAKATVVDSSHVDKALMVSQFGWPKEESETYPLVAKDLHDCYKHLMSGPGLERMVNTTISSLKANINNLVSFSERPIDQMTWERISGAEVVTSADGTRAVQVGFRNLVREFVAITATPSLMGHDFISNYPSYWTDLWTMDRAFFYLATGLPRWVPIPTLTRGHIARRNMVRKVESFEIAMDKDFRGEDPGSNWTNLDDVGNLVKARQELYRKHNLSFQARASCEVSLIWAANANANPAITLLLHHIYADKDLLASLRQEVAPFVHIFQPRQDFPIPEPARLESVDLAGLETQCPLLKSAYIETLRFDTGVHGFRTMREDYVLGGKANGDEKLLLRNGTHAHIAFDLHNKDPAYFDDPMIWKADRHIRYEASENSTEPVAKVDMGTIRSYGGGTRMCKGRHFASKEILIFVSVIISMWDIESAEGGPPRIPRTFKGPGTNGIKDDVKVLIKRREIAAL